MASRTVPRRRRLAAATLLLAAPGLAACGFGVQTNQPYQPGVGANATEGTAHVLGATIVVEGQEAAEQGTFVAGLVNDDVEQGVELVGVTSESGDYEVQLLAPIEIGPQDITSLTESGAVLVLGDLEPGGYVRLVFSFDNGDAVSINVPVVNDGGPYADVVPAQGPDDEVEDFPLQPPAAEPPGEDASPEPEPPVETPTEGPSSNPEG